jgi:hypothetical protein
MTEMTTIKAPLNGSFEFTESFRHVAKRIEVDPRVIAEVRKAGGPRARKVGVHPNGNRKQRRGYYAAAAKL